MPCECIHQMNAKLADHNTKLGITFGWTKHGQQFTLPTIQTEKIEKRVRKGPAIAVPTFCPFCGVRYFPEPAEQSAEGGAV